MRKPRKKKKVTPRVKSMKMAKKRGRFKKAKRKKNNYSWLTAGKKQEFTPNILAMHRKKKVKE